MRRSFSQLQSLVYRIGRSNNCRTIPIVCGDRDVLVAAGLLFLLAIFAFALLILTFFFLLFRVDRDSLRILHARLCVRYWLWRCRWRYGLRTLLHSSALLGSAALFWRLCNLLRWNELCRRNWRWRGALEWCGRRGDGLTALFATSTLLGSSTLFRLLRNRCRRELRWCNRSRCRALRWHDRLCALLLTSTRLLRPATLLQRLCALLLGPATGLLWSAALFLRLRGRC